MQRSLKETVSGIIGYALFERSVKQLLNEMEQLKIENIAELSIHVPVTSLDMYLIFAKACRNKGILTNHQLAALDMSAKMLLAVEFYSLKDKLKVKQIEQ